MLWSLVGLSGNYYFPVAGLFGNCFIPTTPIWKLGRCYLPSLHKFTMMELWICTETGKTKQSTQEETVLLV